MDFQKLVSYMNSLLGFHRHNGIRLVEAGPGRAVVEAGITRDSLNPMGFIHGGLMFTMADMAAGCACLTHGRGVVTLGASASYLAPARGDRLRAAATEEHCGKTTGVYRVEVTDPEGKLVAVFTVTMYLTEKTLEL